MEILYRVTRDGEKASNFHSICNNKGKIYYYSKVIKKIYLDDILQNLGQAKMGTLPMMIFLYSH